MRRIEPFTDLNEAQQVLDNGGRWYHWFSRADDEEITTAEMSRAADAHGDALKSVYYTMATSELRQGYKNT